MTLFSLDLEADQTAHITGISRNTINKYYRAFRERIVQLCDEDSPLSGEVEVDESYFGARSVKGKRGRGAYGETIVSGLLKRESKVHTGVILLCLHLKECEFKFNHRGEDIYKILLEIFKKEPLKLS